MNEDIVQEILDEEDEGYYEDDVEDRPPDFSIDMNELDEDTRTVLRGALSSVGKLQQLATLQYLELENRARSEKLDLVLMGMLSIVLALMGYVYDDWAFAVLGVGNLAFVVWRFYKRNTPYQPFPDDVIESTKAEFENDDE